MALMEMMKQIQACSCDVMAWRELPWGYSRGKVPMNLSHVVFDGVSVSVISLEKTVM